MRASPDAWLISVKASAVGGWGVEIPRCIQQSPAFPLPPHQTMHCSLWLLPRYALHNISVNHNAGSALPRVTGATRNVSAQISTWAEVGVVYGHLGLVVAEWTGS